jgi:DNA topoisomerase IB
MVVFARTLPELRKRVDAELAEADELTYDRVCACAVRLLDRGFFRVGARTTPCATRATAWPR